MHLEGWKHGYGDTGLNMVCTQKQLLCNLGAVWFCFPRRRNNGFVCFECL